MFIGFGTIVLIVIIGLSSCSCAGTEPAPRSSRELDPAVRRAASAPGYCRRSRWSFSPVVMAGTAPRQGRRRVLRSFAQSPCGPWRPSWSRPGDRPHLVVPRAEMAPHPRRSPGLSSGVSSPRRGGCARVRLPYPIAHCAAWPAARQPRRFDIACAQLTTACTWPESSAGGTAPTMGSRGPVR